MGLYSFAKSVVKTIFKMKFKITVLGTENVPKAGPVIVCANHISNYDPPLVGITFPREIHFLAKEELFENKFLGALLRKLHAFPIKRGMRDRNALRQGLNVLKEGNVLGLFPEGTRSKTGVLKKGLAGAGFFALRSDAQIVPCAIIGSYESKKLLVVYGKPMNMDTFRAEKANPQEVTDAIMDEIRKLKESHPLETI